MKKYYLSSHFKKFIAFLLVAGTVFALTPVNSFAASKTPGFGSKELFYWYYESCGCSYSLAYSKPTDKIISLTCSDKKVATVKKGKSSYGYPMVSMRPQKPGTTKLTVKVKRGKKTYTSSVKVTFIKLANPFKSIKVGNKEYVNTFKKATRPWISVPLSGKKKITVTTNSDWTYKRAWIRQKDNSTISYHKGEKANLNSAIQIGIVLQNNKFKNSEMTIWLDKK